MSSFKRSKLKTKKGGLANLKATQKSRKQLRKEERKQKKINRATYFQKKRESCMAHKQLTEHENSATIDEDGKNNNSSTSKDVTLNKKIIKEKKRELESKKLKQKQKQKLLTDANLKEDKIIKKLEKQLKLNKRKKKTVPKSFVADGLDDLLNFCLEKDRNNMLKTEGELPEDDFHDEFKADLAMAVEDAKEPKEHIFIDEPCQTKRHKTNENEENDKNNRAPAIANESVSDSNLEVFRSEETTESDAEQDGISVHSNIDEDFWEDIYGRKRDRKGNVVCKTTKYVPPAARAVAGNQNIDDEKLHYLRKRLKGCLNRVAEQNIHSIASQIEELYMTNSRNNMNYMLSSLIFEALISRVLTPDRLVSEHMMLIAALHANVGIEVGADFLEKLVKKFAEMIEEESQDVENKQLDNVILMISHLYNFKVYGHKLLYQILDKLVIKFSEKEIELILIILRTVGFPLRKDDPIALKEFIQSLQQKASNEGEKSSRVKFMLDVLLAIKNNNVSKIPQYDPSHVEHLKKIIRSVIRKGKTITRFNVSLEDLLYADESGKWWIVGSAWSGSNNLDNLDNRRKLKQEDSLRFGEKILELAQKQRMNTDIRRNIFCILMTAEDYLDAFEKLHRLGLKDRQEEEIIHVLLHCCLQENEFNLYYAVLAQKLCEYNRKYQLTIQYNLWDKLKTLESLKTKQLSNLARFLTHLFVQKCLAFSILKVIQFTELDKYTVKFLRQIILGILLHKDEQDCLQVFQKISSSPQLQAFREGLGLFINYFLIKNIDSSGISDQKAVILKERTELVERILVSHGSKVIF